MSGEKSNLNCEFKLKTITNYHCEKILKMYKVKHGAKLFLLSGKVKFSRKNRGKVKLQNIVIDLPVTDTTVV